MKPYILLIGFVAFLPSNNQAQSLKLPEYLSQVEAAHEGLQASKLKKSAYMNEARERGLLLSPNLVGDAKYLNDSKPSGNPSISGTQTKATAYSLGVSQLTPFGLKGEIKYEISSVDIIGASSNFVPLASYYEGRPILQASQSLWRNFFGSETRAQLDALEAKSLGSSFLESYKTKQMIAAAEVAYWRARLAQKAIELRKETLSRAQELKAWTLRRVNLQLADRSDLLQAEAALQGRTIELQKAEEDGKEAFRNFNALRGQDTEAIEEKFEDPNPAELKSLSVQTHAPLRDDTKAAEQFSRASSSAAQLTLEKGRPTLEVSGSVALNGRDAKFNPTVSDSLGRDHPTYAVALSLSTPLNFGAASALREGARQEQEAAELEYKRKIFDQEQEWKNLERKLSSAKVRLDLLRTLESSEQEKAKHERDRLRKGRTTTFQVLLFETDLLNAKLNRLLTETEILTLAAQLKTFL